MKINIKSIAASVMTVVFAFGFQGALASVCDVSYDNDSNCSCSENVCPVDCDGFVNELTGPNSINENTSTINRDVNFTVNNDVTACDEFDVAVDTSVYNDDVVNNTVVGDIETGSAMVDVSVIHDLNGDPLAIPEMGSIIVPGSMMNSITGPFSENTNRVVVNDNTNIDINNVASYRGNYDLDANTGGTIVSGNTSVGDVETGDVEMNITEKVTLNRHANSVSFPDVQTIKVPSLANSVTGPNSTNTNTFKVNSDYNVSVNNIADIKNTIDATANTGGNVIEGNTCVGDIRTGDVKFNFNIQSSAN